MLLIAVLPLPYAYYVLLRVVVCGTFALGALIAYKQGREATPIYYLLVAILFNPFSPFFHAKEVWVIFDLATALLLYKTAPQVADKNKSSEKISRD